MHFGQLKAQLEVIHNTPNLQHPHKRTQHFLALEKTQKKMSRLEVQSEKLTTPFAIPGVTYYLNHRVPIFSLPNRKYSS